MSESEKKGTGCGKPLLYGCGGLVAVVVLMSTCVGIVGSCGTQTSERARPEAAPTQPSTSQAQRGFVSRETWSESTPWPLTVDQGRLLCIDRGGNFKAVYLDVDGRLYGVNGWANTWADEYDAEPIDPIWLVNEERMEMMRELFPDEEITPTYISIGPLIDKGLRLCD